MDGLIKGWLDKNEINQLKIKILSIFIIYIKNIQIYI